MAPSIYDINRAHCQNASKEKPKPKQHGPGNFEMTIPIEDVHLQTMHSSHGLQPKKGLATAYLKHNMSQGADIKYSRHPPILQSSTSA